MGGEGKGGKGRESREGRKERGGGGDGMGRERTVGEGTGTPLHMSALRGCWQSASN